VVRKGPFDAELLALSVRQLIRLQSAREKTAAAKRDALRPPMVSVRSSISSSKIQKSDRRR